MNPAPSPSPSQAETAGRWLWVIGVAGVVCAARLQEIHFHAGETPFKDQWEAEARQILVPWLQGKLSWPAFFSPHNEHVPAWARLLAWLQAALFGRWDPQLQATINAALHGVFAGVVAGWLRRSLPLWPACGLSLLVVVLGSLPFSWENSVWGFQSHTPLALLFVFLHIRGSFARPPGSTGWWLAQAAGFAALFTYGSMWAAPAAVMLTALWTAAPDRRRWIAAAVLAVAGLTLLLVARGRQDPGLTRALTAHTPQEFLAAFLMQLGWPAVWAGACVVLWLPSFLLTLQLRRKVQAENFDRIVVALAVWAAAQATAFAFARGGGYIGFVSRYGDLLALGVVANGAALWRLAQASRAWRIMPAVALTVVWLATVTQGLQLISTRGHTEFFHERSELWANLRRDAVRQYLATKDLSALSSQEVRDVLYPSPEVVARVLDQPGLVDLLPAGLRPTASPMRGDPLSAAAAWVRSVSTELVCSGVVVLLLGFWLVGRNPSPMPPFAFAPDPWRAPVLVVLGLAVGGLVFLWPKPLEFSAQQRRQTLLAPPGTVSGLTFQVVTETPYPKDNLAGGAALWPDEFRNFFFGTLIGGADFTGIAQSSRFPISSPWLIIPFAGYPVSPGNGLRLSIEDAAGNRIEEIGCPGPNPADIDFWAVDVKAHIGRSARIMLYDGRKETESWVAAAPPQPATSPEIAGIHRRDRAAEPTRFGQNSLGIIALASLLLGAASTLASRTRRG